MSESESVSGIDLATQSLPFETEDRVPARGVRSDQEVIDSGKAGVHISERPQAS